MSVSLIMKERRHGTWTWRCRRTTECRGFGAGLRTVAAAIREADRHNREKHRPHERREAA